MKTLLTLSLLLPLFGFRVMVIASGSNPKPDGPVSFYQYTYSSTSRFPVRFYEVKPDDSGTLCLRWSVNDEDISVIRAPQDALERIGELVAQHKLHKLKNSYRPRMEVLDGHGWYMIIRFRENSISAGGSNAWPPAKLDAGIHAINAYLQSLIDASTEADIIRHESHLDR